MAESMMKINDDVTVGSQPTEEELRQLADQGFKAVVNFRTDGETDQPLSPDAEGHVVEAAGMKYVHMPVSVTSIEAALVDEFRERFANLPKPVFAHCQGGKRAGALVMMHIAAERGMSGDQTLQQAEQLGFECDHPELKRFVREYVDSHAASP